MKLNCLMTLLFLFLIIGNVKPQRVVSWNDDRTKITLITDHGTLQLIPIPS